MTPIALYLVSLTFSALSGVIISLIFALSGVMISLIFGIDSDPKVNALMGLVTGLAVGSVISFFALQSQKLSAIEESIAQTNDQPPPQGS